MEVNELRLARAQGWRDKLEEAFLLREAAKTQIPGSSLQATFDDEAQRRFREAARELGQIRQAGARAREEAVNGLRNAGPDTGAGSGPQTEQQRQFVEQLKEREWRPSPAEREEAPTHRGSRA